MNQNPYRYYSQQYPYAAPPYSTTPPPVPSWNTPPTQDRMFEHLHTFQTQMMAQQQQQMNQMEQRFQETMSKTVADIAQSLTSSKHDEPKQNISSPPAEIAYSSDQSTSTQTDIALPPVEATETGSLSSAQQAQ